MVASEMTILIIEDDDIDADSMRRAITRQRIANRVVRARDGEEGLEVLRATAAAPEDESAYCILLDLNMPRMTGQQFLEVVRDDPQLQSHQIFVLASSWYDPGALDACKPHIAGYLCKGRQFADQLSKLDVKWSLQDAPSHD